MKDLIKIIIGNITQAIAFFTMGICPLLLSVVTIVLGIMASQNKDWMGFFIGVAIASFIYVVLVVAFCIKFALISGDFSEQEKGLWTKRLVFGSVVTLPFFVIRLYLDI